MFLLVISLYILTIKRVYLFFFVVKAKLSYCNIDYGIQGRTIYIEALPKATLISFKVVGLSFSSRGLLVVTPIARLPSTTFTLDIPVLFAFSIDLCPFPPNSEVKPTLEVGGGLSISEDIVVSPRVISIISSGFSVGSIGVGILDRLSFILVLVAPYFSENYTPGNYISIRVTIEISSRAFLSSRLREVE